MPKVSVIIVNYNGLHLLKECLDSLRKQTFRDFEIILVDNASSDGSVDFVKSHYPDVKIIVNEENLGYGGGNNVGIKSSEGKYVVLLNNDTRVHNRWLEELVNVAERDYKIGMCASKILNYDNPEIIDNTGLLMYPDGLARGRGRLEKDRGQFDKQEEVFFPSGCAALYRREMLDEIGLFDEDFFLYLDDVDIGLRGRLAGWKCMYVPDAVVYHRYSATAEPYSPLKAFLVERNRLWIVLKYFPVRLIFTSLFYTFLRYLVQGYGVLRGKGAGSHLLKSESALKSIGILIEAYLSALSRSGKMLKRRREIMKIKRVSNKDFYGWLKRYGIGVKEIALKD